MVTCWFGSASDVGFGTGALVAVTQTVTPDPSLELRALKW